MVNKSLKGVRDVLLPKGGITNPSLLNDYGDLNSIIAMLDDMMTYRGLGKYHDDGVELDETYAQAVALATCTCNSRIASNCDCNARTACSCNSRTLDCSCNVRTTSCSCNLRTTSCNCNLRTTSCSCNLRTTSCSCNTRDTGCSCVLRAVCDIVGGGDDGSCNCHSRT